MWAALSLITYSANITVRRPHPRATARSAAWSRDGALRGMVARPARSAAWSRVPRAAEFDRIDAR
jgi:hypothetical protein